MKDAIQVCAHQPPLLPCPMCGGRAEVVRAWEPYFVRCAKCGLRTCDRPFDRNIDREWNRRANRHARALTIAELTESAAGLFDDTGVAAVWIEGLELMPRGDGQCPHPSAPEALPPSLHAPALLRFAEAPAAPGWNPQDSPGLVAPAGSGSGATAAEGKAMPSSGADAPPSPRGKAFGNRGKLTAALIRVGFRYADLAIDVMDAGGEWRELDRETIERYGTDWRIWDKRPGTEREQGTGNRAAAAISNP